MDASGLQKLHLDAGSLTCPQPQPTTSAGSSPCHPQCFRFPVANRTTAVTSEEMGQRPHWLPPSGGWTTFSPWLVLRLPGVLRSILQRQTKKGKRASFPSVFCRCSLSEHARNAC